MSAPDELRDLIERRKNKAIRQILDRQDELIDDAVSRSAALALRKVVLDELNDFTDVVLGLVAHTTDDSYAYNTVALEMIAAVYERVTGEAAPLDSIGAG